MEDIAVWLGAVIGPQALGVVKSLYWGLIKPIFDEPRLILPFIATTLLTAAAYFYWQRRLGKVQGSMMQLLFPRSVLLHPSAKLDYKFFIVNQILGAHLGFGKIVIALVGLLSVSSATSDLLATLLGERSRPDAPPGTVVLVVFTIVNLLAYDLAKWYAHYLTHKIPVLWEFHKVHHAEEVLTPISAFRAHPVDVMLDFFFRLLFAGIVGGVFAYCYPQQIKELTILGFNAVAVVLSLWINHLQHSHVPLSYGRFNRILLGPVMHQVHHSCEIQHWDKNFGFVFGIWDWMFGTLHIPKEGERLTLGLPVGKGAGEYRTLLELYFRPFIGVWRVLTAPRHVAPLS